MFIMKKSIYIIILAISIAGCGKVSNNEEVEPNNTVSTATPIEAGRSYSGLLDRENDIDNYLLTVNEEQIIKIELSSVKGVNHAMQIWRLEAGNLQLVKSIDDNRKSSPEEIANLYVFPGNYIIQITHGSRDVRKGNPENRYNLKITSRGLFNEEKEPNDNLQMANPINSGDLLTGYFSPSQNRMNENLKTSYREEDWFATDIIADEENPVMLDILLTGVAGVDSVLTLYDFEMREIAFADNASSGGAEAIRGLGVKVSGKYYILVASKSFQYNHSEPFELSIKTGIHDSGIELEPNNSFDTSSGVVGARITGKIDYNGDLDYFYYNEIKDGNVKIRLQNDSGLNTVITIYGSDKIKLIETDKKGTGDEIIIPALFVNDGIFIKVNPVNTSPDILSYRLTFEPLQIDTPLEAEPNNSLKEADHLTRIISGFTSFKNDKDYFLISTNGRIKYKVNVEGPGNGIIKLSTTDQMGYIIKTRTVSNGETVSFQELFDRKGYILVETIVPDFENMYKIIIEEIR